MPPIIDEQTDELKARRQRRKGRQEPPAVNGSTPPGQSAGAARDLLRGLITDGARRDEERSPATDPGSESKPAAAANPEREDRIASESAPRTPREGEAIDDLIRRVKDSAAGAAVEASSTLQQRRPKGTADLARDAATSRAAARRRAPETELRSTDVAPTPKKHRRVVAAMVLLAGIAVLVVTLAGTGGSVPRRLDASIASSRLAAARSSNFGGALQATIAAIAPELQAVARRATTSARAARTRLRAKRRAIRSHARRARSKHRAAAVRRAAVTNSPPSTTGTQTQTPPAAQAPTSTASQTSATSQPSATSSSRPAGPTGSNPLGGIGSCVKGC